MARKCFYSFHYIPDNWRASQVRNIGKIEGNSPASDNDWESVKRGGDPVIKRWINAQMKGRSCTIVLVGEETANRKWINYEIVESWNQGMGVVAIHINGLRDRNNETSSEGNNPFDYITLGSANTKLSAVAKCHRPPGLTSKDKYRWISDNIQRLVEEAIRIRKDY